MILVTEFDNTSRRSYTKNRNRKSRQFSSLYIYISSYTSQSAAWNLRMFVLSYSNPRSVEPFFLLFVSWSLLHSAVLPFRAESLHTHVILQWVAFHSVFLNIQQSGVLTALTWLVPGGMAAVWARCVHVHHTPHTIHIHHTPYTTAVHHAALDDRSRFCSV